MTERPKLQLIEDRLGEPLPRLIAQLRDDDRSWRWIARHVATRTGVPVSHTTIREYAAAGR